MPAKLRMEAHLEKDVVLAGVGSRVEIWDKNSWQAITSYDDADDLASDMEGLGI